MIQNSNLLTLLSLNLPLSSHPLQVVNGCRNSRLVVDEDEFEVGEKLQKIAMYWLINFKEIVIVKPLVVGKLGLFTVM